MKHLNKRAKNIVFNFSTEERIKYIKNINDIHYNVARKTIEKLNYLMEQPRSIRAQNILLFGDKNNGKTTILRLFKRSHKAYMEEKTGKLIYPLSKIQSPSSPDEMKFYTAILSDLLYKTKTKETLEERHRRVLNYLNHLNTKALIIDDLDNSLNCSNSEQKVFLNMLKNLSNDLQLSLICSGSDLALKAIQSDEQMSNRFNTITLPIWTNNLDFNRLLLSFERILPLKEKSNLIDISISTRILDMSEGILGEITNILKLSSILAIKSGEEKITEDILKKIKYISPNKKRKNN